MSVDAIVTAIGIALFWGGFYMLYTHTNGHVALSVFLIIWGYGVGRDNR